MRIAIPLAADEQLSSHFGASEKVALFTVDPAARAVLSREVVLPPVEEPCGWAGWLQEQGVDLLIAAGLGGGARSSLAAAGIQAIAGARTADPRKLVRQWLDGSLRSGANPCFGAEHGHDHEHCACGCHH